MGSLFALALVWIWLQNREIKVLVAERIKDQKEMGDIIKSNSIVLESFSNATEARSRAIEAMTLSQQLAVAAQGELTRALMALREDVNALKGTAQALRDAILQRGVKL